MTPFLKLNIEFILSYSSKTLKFIGEKLSRDMEAWWAEVILSWAVHLNLPHVCIPTILMIAYHSYLNHECSDGPVVQVFYGNHNPTTRLIQIHHFHLLKIVEVRASSNADSRNGRESNYLIVDVHNTQLHGSW